MRVPEWTARMLRRRTAAMVLDLLKRTARLLRSVPRRLRGRESVFTRIYTSNGWGNRESVSGDGSSLRETRIARQLLPALVARDDVNVLLDIPCGDCNWMREIDFCGRSYIGADIVSKLIERNTTEYGGPQRPFHDRGGGRAPLPAARLVP